MRWNQQDINGEQTDALPGLAKLNNLVRTVRTPEFAGMTFYEVLAKSALNKVPGRVPSAVPNTTRTPIASAAFGWTINPMRGCQHACAYCFARPTHGYLDLDAGKDFDTQIIVKVNVAEVLARELAKPSWARQPVAMGTNTDPYQRAEGRYQLMPGIIAVLAESRTPFSILTKGTLLRRDIPLLVEASRETNVELAMSIAIYDDDLQQSVEPGTPTAKARLATVTAVREAGMNCSVFLMPILPFLTDTTEHLDNALQQIKASGASSVLYSSMYLKPGTKEWFMLWLEREHPELVTKYLEFYSGGPYAPVAYRKWLADRIKPLMRKHRLERGREDPITGGPLTPSLLSSSPSSPSLSLSLSSPSPSSPSSLLALARASPETAGRSFSDEELLARESFDNRAATAPQPMLF
ncbi:MAG: Rv2578c family radical SAM protein [Microbacteriaceae bacterium]|nr:Rv2578c family radical SAM protein [Microbacteriaceae bacterium]